MQARDLMTTGVISVTADIKARDIARLLPEHRISAVPVVDSEGAVLGMVIEGDLLLHRGDQDEKDLRRSWWLTLLAEGEPLSSDFLSQLASAELTAAELMSSPAIVVDESAYDTEIADVLITRGIKRVPVTANGRLVGIVSRADLVQAQANLWKPSVNTVVR